jgi:hypothetical protein
MIGKQKRFAYGVALFALVVLLSVYGAFGQSTSANYRIEPMVIDGGGGQSASTNFSMNSSVGQAAIGRNTSTNYVNESGFIHSTNFAEYDFALGRQGWQFGTSVPFSSPNSAAPVERLDILPTSNTNNFGYWYSPEAIPLVADYLYRCRFWVSTDIVPQANVPVVRMRALVEGGGQAQALQVTSAGAGDASPTPAGTRYDLYLYPQQALTGLPDMDLSLAIDILGFDPGDSSSGRVSLEQVAVDLFDPTALAGVTTVRDYTFNAGDEGWTYATSAPPFNLPTFAWNNAAGTLDITSTDNTLQFGFWNNNSGDITATAGLLYRATFSARTDWATNTQVPGARFRLASGNFQLASVQDVNTQYSPQAGLTTSNKDYPVYFLPPAGGLLAAFDIQSFDPSHHIGTTLSLDRCLVESMTPPTMP